VAAHTLVRGAALFPDALLALSDAPRELHVGCSLDPSAARIAIVGARAATAYGLRITAQLARDLARLGYTIVSGLARGIDAAAHDAALEAGGSSVAVIPLGLDRVLPPEHAPLAARVAASGALVSEWPERTASFQGMYVRRNRLIAALSSATIVVEAAERSGSLSTARVARRLGRVLLAVPGDLDREQSRGTNALLHAGARVCRCAGDVVEALAAPRGATPVPARRARAGVPGAAARPVTPTAVTPEARVLSCLDAGGPTVDALAERAGLATSETLAALLALEWSGVAEPLAGQRWRRAAR